MHHASNQNTCSSPGPGILTLIELLVVIAIIATLMGIMLPSLRHGSTNVTLAVATLSKFAASTPGGLKIGHTDHNGNPASVASPAASPSPSPRTQLGDVNGSGSINSADATQLVLVLVGTDTQPRSCRVG